MKPALQAEQEVAVQQPDQADELLMRAEEVQTLLAVQRAITSRLDPEMVLQMIADEALRLASADMSAVYLLHEDHLKVSVVSGIVNQDVLGFEVPLEGSLAGEAIRTGKAFLVAGEEKDQSGYQPLVEKAGARSYVIVPLISAAGPLGVITVASIRTGSLGQDARRLLMMLAPGAVIALENSQLYEQARQAAALMERQRLVHDLHDAVTQTLFSASLIAEVLPQIWQRSPQEGLARLEELRQLTRGALVEMRSLLDVQAAADSGDFVRR